MTKFRSDLLQPFAGYLALGMYSEANDELENLPTELKTHPDVLLARLDLLMELHQWEEGVLLADSLCKLWPHHNEFHFRTAYCLHELKRTQEARETLVSGPNGLRSDAVFFYNLACYEAQLGNIQEAKKQLDVCFTMNKAYKTEALNDPDLEPVWITRRNGLG